MRCWRRSPEHSNFGRNEAQSTTTTRRTKYMLHRNNGPSCHNIEERIHDLAFAAFLPFAIHQLVKEVVLLCCSRTTTKSIVTIWVCVVLLGQTMTTTTMMPLFVLPGRRNYHYSFERHGYHHRDQTEIGFSFCFPTTISFALLLPLPHVHFVPKIWKPFYRQPFIKKDVSILTHRTK